MRNKSYVNISKVNSKEIAYILGFLWADGYINTKRNTIATTINKTDSVDIIKIFNMVGEWLNYSYKRYDKRTKNTYESFTISATSTIFTKFLLSVNFDKKSTHSPDKLLSTIPDKFKSYFFRGYSDGDGCFYKKSSQCQYILTSTFEQDWTFIENLFNKLKIVYNIVRLENTNKNGKIYKYSQIRITNKLDIVIFGEYLYNNPNNLYLKRKFDKYDDIKNSNINTSKRWTTNEIKILKENYKLKTNFEISKMLNRTKYSVEAKSSKLKLKNNF